MLYTVKSNLITYKISSLGAELQSAVSVGGVEYVWQGGDIWNGHAPVLFPLCGRLKDNRYTLGGKEYNMSCHGFFPSSVPEVVSHSEEKIVFSLCETEESLRVYPFKFKMTLTYEARDNELYISAEIENRSACEMPFMYGAHPAIRVPLDEGLSFEDYKIDFGKAEILINPLTEGIPYVNPVSQPFLLDGGEYTLSQTDIARRDTLVFSDTSGKVRLHSPRGKRSVEITYDDAFKYLCLWKQPVPEAEFICIEPWTGIPQDGYTDEVFETRPSMIRLSPDESVRLCYKIKFCDTEALG